MSYKQREKVNIVGVTLFSLLQLFKIVGVLNYKTKKRKQTIDFLKLE